MSTYDLAVLLLALGVGLTFAAHGAQKAFGWWGGPGLAGWKGALSHMGFRPVPVFAAASIGAELGGGLMLALGVLTPIAAAIIVAQTIVIVFHVHWAKGFWNGQGGIEFPLLIGIGAAVVGLLDPTTLSVDHVLGIEFSTGLRLTIIALGVVAGLVSLAIPRLGSHQGPSAQAS